MNNLTSLALVLLGAFWSGTSAIFTGIKETNAVRDRIIVGKVEDHELSYRDRWHAFWWDWAPMKLSLSLISGVLCVVILVLPTLSEANTNFTRICFIAAMPALGVAHQFVSFLADAVYLGV
jgi:hypothetical protein